MSRKKVKTQVIKESVPKKRPTKQPEEKKKQIIKSADNKPTRWDKVKGVNGKIIRIKQGDQENHVEIGKLVGKGKARHMYVGVDGDYLYHYYEIFKEK
jgi:lipid II:glycine glycyltransferase (peptidoglycan interpeptide bridge formation enzyme)